MQRHFPPIQRHFPSMQLHFPPMQLHFPPLQHNFPSLQRHFPSLQLHFPPMQLNFPSCQIFSLILSKSTPILQIKPMLKLNLNRLFRNRLITKPVGFLMNHGFGRNSAFKLANSRIKYLSTENIEMLCLALRCTPSDLFDWSESPNTLVPEDHPIRSLIPETATPLQTIVQNLNLNELKSLSKSLNSKNFPNPDPK